MTRIKNGRCRTCKRDTHLTFHHLIPRKVHRRTHFKKNYTRQELQAGISVCRQCHSGIHRRFNEMELAKQLNTLEHLLGNAQLSDFFSWVAKQRVESP